MSWIQTFRGGQFFPIEPRHDDIDVRDIAHALSMICRFNGHCLRFYSVAEHCVLMARKVSPAARRWALLHDAAEAYLSDVPKPLKTLLVGYDEAEARLMEKIAYRLGLFNPMPDEVKKADARILMDERMQNMAPAPAPWGNEHIEPLGVTLEYWLPAQAKQEFLAALHAATEAEYHSKLKQGKGVGHVLET